MATSVDAESSDDASSGTSSDTSTSDTSTSDTSTSDTSDTDDTDDTSTSSGGCVDGGNLSPDDDVQLAQASASQHGSPEFEPGPLAIPPDYGHVSECDEYAQDCPAEEKCVPYSSTGGTWDDNTCVPVQGAGMIGDPCIYAGPIEATDDCGLDSACWLVDDQGMGTCTGFCSGSAQTPECPLGQYCLQLYDAVAFCVDGCNPLEQACPEEQGCFWTGEAFSCTPTAAQFPAGEACGDFDDCRPGMICVDAELLPSCGGASCCAEFCDLDCPDLCSQVGTSCVPFFEMGQAPIGEGDIGVCMAPL
jgi:hypothetical protein